MSNSTRTANSIKSAATGAVGQMITVLLQFVSRTVFIKTIGAQYLGINGLFTSVLTILSISELGIGTAVVYSLYKPLASDDKKTIQATMNLLKVAYRIVGFAVLALGLVLYPFLPYLIKGTTDLVNVNLIYALYVLNSVFSYWFFAYKSALLLADQKRYVINLIGNAVAIVTVILQIFVLAFLRSFVGYVVVQMVGSILKSLCSSVFVSRHYPYVVDGNKEKLPGGERRKIFKNLFALSMNKVSSTVLNATDNLIISGAISTLVVGMYSNYYAILNALTQLVHNIFSAFTASIGNLFVVESKEKNEFIFRCINFLNFWIYGFCAICLWNLFNPFIGAVWGRDMLFGEWTVLAIVLNFLTDGLQSAVVSYKDACGLFWPGRYMPLISAAINLGVSLLLVKPLGVAGVFLGTIISRFLTTWWYNAKLIHKRAFGTSPVRYFVRYFAFLFLTCAVGGAISLATKPLEAYGMLCLFCVRLLVCLVAPNLLFWLLFRKTKEFGYVAAAAKPIINKIFFKRKVDKT